MKILFRFYLIALLSSGISAQSGFKCSFMPSHTQNNASRFVFESTNGQYIAGGMSIDTASGTPVSCLTLCGLSATGQVLWQKRYGRKQFQYLSNALNSRVATKQGNHIYYTGCALDSNNKYQGILIKLDFNGDTLWQKIYRDSQQDVVPQMLTKGLDNSFLITGYFQVGGVSTMLIKTKLNGDEIWRKKINKNNPNVSAGNAILQDSLSKNIIIGGYQYDQNSNMVDQLLIVDSLGNNPARYQYLGIGGIVKDFVQGQDKHLVVVGMNLQQEKIGGNHLSTSYILKININNPFNPVWSNYNYDKKTLLNLFTSVCLRQNGDILLAGALDTVSMLNNLEHNLNRITSFNSSGQVNWNRIYDYKSLNNTGIHVQGIRAIESTSDNGWVVAIDKLNYGQTNSLFYVKYDASGCDSSAAHCATLNLVGMPEKAPLSSLPELIPNPASDYVWWRHETESFIRYDLVEIYDALGNKVLSVPKGKQRVSVQHLPNGLYLVKFLEKDVLLGTKKLMVLH